jgi:exosortase A-associated hydrolase 1
MTAAPPFAATLAESTAEQAFSFSVEGDTLLGILHAPAIVRSGTTGTGVVIVVGGPQYRGGSHRQFVQLARRLAHEGHAVLRFDVRGMGDSSGAPRSFEHIGADIHCALAQLHQRQPGLRRVVLWGLCDGASAALLYLHDHPGAAVHGLCLLNPWVRSEASLARTQVRHYYGQRLLQRDFWAKLLRGRVAGDALRGLWRSLRAALAKPTPSGSPGACLPYQQRMAQAWAAWGARGRPLLLVLSSHDYTAREFEDSLAADPHWKGALQRPGVQRHDAVGADHTFSAGEQRRALEALTLDWLQRMQDAERPAVAT